MPTARRESVAQAKGNLVFHPNNDILELIKTVEWESQYALTERGHDVLSHIDHDDFVCPELGIFIIAPPRVPHPVISVYIDTNEHHLNGLFGGEGLDFRFRYSGGGFPHQVGIKIGLTTLYPDIMQWALDGVQDLSDTMIGRIEHEEEVNPKRFEPSLYPRRIRYTYLSNLMKSVAQQKALVPQFVVASRRKLLMFHVRVPAAGNNNDYVRVGLEMCFDRYRYYQLKKNMSIYVDNSAERHRAILQDITNPDVTKVNGRFLRREYGLEIEYKPGESDSSVRARDILKAEKILCLRAQTLLDVRVGRGAPDATIQREKSSKAKKGYQLLNAGMLPK
jgi:hypothetical protein